MPTTYRLEPVPTRRYRVIQWFTGQLGKEQIRQIHRHPHLELVGAVCWHPEKDGVDAGEIAGIGPIGVKTTCDINAALSIDADIVLLNPLDASVDLMERILRSGKNLINIMGAWDLRVEPYHERIRQAALAGNASVHGAGNMPGMLNDVLPMLLSGYSTEIRHIRCRERSYHGNHQGRDSLLMLGYSLPAGERGPDSPIGRHILEMYRSGTHQGNYTVADAMGRIGPATHFETRISAHDLALAPEDFHIETADLTIRKGTIAGMRFEMTSYIDGQPWHVVEMEHVARLGLGPQWRNTLEEHEFMVRLEGKPVIECTFGTIDSGATGELMGLIQLNAARLINLIPSVVEARPGCITFMDLPLVTAWA